MPETKSRRKPKVEFELRPKPKLSRKRRPKPEFELLPKPKLSRKRRPKPRSWWVALLLAVFLGPFGADRFYLGRTRSAVIKLVTLSCLGVWWVTDFVLIASDWRLDAWGRRLKH